MSKKWKSISRKKKRLMAVILAALVLVFAACYTVFIAPLLKKEKWVYKETSVERGTLTVGVTESGTLEYGISQINYELKLDAGNEDEEDEDEEDEDSVQKYLKIEEIYVAPGQRISEGDALLKFTEDSVSDVRKLLQGALADAQVAYNEAESEYDLSVLEAKTEYDTQKVSESYAAVIYQTADSAIDDEIAAMQVEIRQRSANISSLEEKIEEAQEDYNDALESYQEAQEMMEATGMDNPGIFLSVQSVYLSAQTKYQSAKSTLEQAQEALTENAKQIESLTAQAAAAQAKRTINRLDAEQNYQETIINGDNAQITYNAQLESLKEDLQEAEEEKKEVEEQLEAFNAFVGEDGILYADGSGIVTEVNYEEGDSLVTVGTVAAYASPEDMTISVDVTQEDVVALAVGDRADISFTAYEDTIYEGTILSIDTTATSRESNTISYTVVIGVAGDTEMLYGGMTADITFVTEEKENVLYISKKAIVEENDKTMVYVKNALGGMELKEVETGISNGVNVEIISGLEEGDTIYIAGRISSEEEIEATAAGASEEENTSLTGDRQGEGSMSSGAGSEGGMPSGMGGGNGMPSGMGSESGMSSGMGGGNGMPSGMGSESGMPSGMEGGNGMPSGMGSEGGIPSGMNSGNGMEARP